MMTWTTLRIEPWVTNQDKERVIKMWMINGLGLEWPSLSWSWSCPYCLGFVSRDQDTGWKAPATYRLTRNQAGKVLDNDQTWGRWPRWIASRLYPPTIPQSVTTVLEVMVCACYFCIGRTYILTKWHHYCDHTRWEFRIGLLLEMLMLLKCIFFTLAF